VVVCIIFSIYNETLNSKDFARKYKRIFDSHEHIKNLTLAKIFLQNQIDFFYKLIINKHIKPFIFSYKNLYKITQSNSNDEYLSIWVDKINENGMIDKYTINEYYIYYNVPHHYFAILNFCKMYM
jgi:hypothetical protein